MNDVLKSDTTLCVHDFVVRADGEMREVIEIRTGFDQEALSPAGPTLLREITKIVLAAKGDALHGPQDTLTPVKGGWRYSVDGVVSDWQVVTTES